MIKAIKKKYLKPGNQYHNRYHITEVLKVTEQSAIYLAEDMMKQNPKQNPIILKYMEIQPKQQKKTKQEYKQISQLQHSNIIRGYNRYSQSNQQGMYMGIIMEYIKGRDLVNLSAKLTCKQKINIYAQLKSLIEYLQTKKNIHIDLEIENILIDKEDNTKVIAFQRAALLKQLEVTQTQKQLDLKKFTKSDNLWQLGIILIQLITKKNIEELMNGKDPVSSPDFPEQIFKKYGIRGKLRQFIQPLLKKDIKQRRFCEQIDYIDSGNILKLRRTTNKQIQQILSPHLDNLVQLDCNNCFLTDECGKYINKITLLHKLDVSGNNLTDKFTYYIKRLLVSLKTLKMAFTNITDDSISLLTTKSKQLQQLDISYTLITSVGIMMLCKLNKLMSLFIWSGLWFYPKRYERIIEMRGEQVKYQNNKIKINQQCITQLCRLKLIELCVNAEGMEMDKLICKMSRQSTCVEVRGRINNKTVEYIFSLEKIEKLYLQGIEVVDIKQFKSKGIKSCALMECKISVDNLIKSLKKCSQLTSLNLHNNNIGAQGAIEIAKNLKNLTFLDLRNNNIEAQGAIEIAKNLTNLTFLNLRNNNIGDQGAIEIAKNLKYLTSLDLRSNKIGAQGAIKIAQNLKNLTSFDLGWNNIGVQGAIKIAHNLKNLSFLDLTYNKISAQGAINIAHNLKNLTSLDLTYNNIGVQGAIEIADNLKNLTSLDLGSNNTCAEGVIEIGKKLTNLISLNLRYNNIGDQGVIEIADNLKNLISLDLSYNNIGTQGAIEIARNLKNLTSLNLSYNNIDDQGVIEIAENLKNLTSLNLRNNYINSQGGIYIAKSLKKIASLNLYWNSIGINAKKIIQQYLPNTILSV